MFNNKKRKIVLTFICFVLAVSVVLKTKYSYEEKEILPILTSPESEFQVTRSLSQERKENMEQISQFDSRFTKIYQDDSNQLEVWIYIDENDYTDSAVDAGYGVVIVKNQKKYIFPEVYYGKIYQACTSKDGKYLYFSSDDVSGTEVLRQRLYVFELKENDVKLATEVFPSDITTELLRKIKAYGDKKTHTISLYDSEEKIFTSNYIEKYKEIEGINYEMQIEYVFDTQVKVKIHPGLKYEGKSMYSFEEIEPVEYNLNIDYDEDTRKIELIRG